MLDPGRPYGLDNLPPDERAKRTHLHVYVVVRVQFCPDTCLTEHLNDCTQAHETYEHVASSRERAAAYIRAHPTNDPLWAWEVWEESVDANDPYEEPDDNCDFWQYAGDGTPLNPYEWWQRYTQPLYRWPWSGADSWRAEAEARAVEAS